jgi:hypothetical protein
MPPSIFAVEINGKTSRFPSSLLLCSSIYTAWPIASAANSALKPEKSDIIEVQQFLLGGMTWLLHEK